jgi:hypothetical protein
MLRYLVEGVGDQLLELLRVGFHSNVSLPPGRRYPRRVWRRPPSGRRQ